jgi:glycosyltransferase involved in cell wall biosynthesis
MFSIVVPAYNRQDYLDEALASVLAQTVTDWECIVVDDASPDVVLTVPDDTRFRLIRNPRNLGIPGARNVGLRAAQGDRVCFLDHDDWYTPDRLASAAGHAEPLTVQTQQFVLITYDDPAVMFHGFLPHLGQVTVRRDICLSFDEQFRVSDDVDWWLRMIAHHRVTTIPVACYCFRDHEWSQLTGRDARLRDSHLLLAKHADFFRANRRARAFRWARNAALARSRRGALVALTRSIAATPTRYALTATARRLAA